MSGSSFRVDKALAAQKPAMDIGVTAASAPPAIITSASPRRINPRASPMELVPEAHAVTVHPLGPCTPNRIDTCPEAMLAIIMGIKKGLTPATPRLSKTLCCCSRVSMPPIPDPTHTPTRCRSTIEKSSAASRTACLAAAQAYCTNRSIRRASLRGIYFCTSKFRTCAAILVGNWLTSKRSIRPMPLFPARRLLQNSSLSRPTGDTTPKPVITTLRSGIPSPLFLTICYNLASTYSTTSCTVFIFSAASSGI